MRPAASCSAFARASSKYESDTGMKRRIVSFSQDAETHWVAELECGHTQHARHDPPLVSRPWVLTAKGRDERVGAKLDCKLCDEAGGQPSHQLIADVSAS